MKTSKKPLPAGQAPTRAGRENNNAKCAALQIPAFEYITFSEVLQ